MTLTNGHRNLLESVDAIPATPEQQNRERILMAAGTLFANKGYAGTSVREIVEAAWVTKPTLYYYFKNKEDLYIKLMDMAVETFSTLLEASMKRQGTMRERLIILFADILRLFQENVDLLRLVNSIIYGPHGATPSYDIMTVSNYLDGVFNAILDAGIQQGELKEEDRHDVMLLLIGLLRSIQVLLVLNMPQRSISLESISRAIDLIFDGARNVASHDLNLKSHSGVRQ